MAGKRILVVTTAEADEERLRGQLRAEIPDDAEVRVVAPATKVSPLDWLTNAEDDARGEAAEAAEQAAEAASHASVEVDRTSQNTDAGENVRDALRQFAPDEIVVVTSRDEEQSWLEEETVSEALETPGVPVRRVEL
jgi:hypothetical protein